MDEPLAELLSTMRRIERKLDTLVAALADEGVDEEEAVVSLDGEVGGFPRDPSSSLG